MKQVKQFLIRAIAAIAVAIVSQSTISVSHAEMSPLAPPNTDSPRATFLQFVDNTNETYRLLMEAQEKSETEGGLFHSSEVKELAAQAEEAMERAVRTLNLVNVPEASKEQVGLESALRLKEILDRISMPAKEQIPDRAEIAADASLVRWEIPGTEIAIVKSNRGQYTGEYLFSPKTVERLSAFYLEVRELPYKPNASEGFYEFYITTAGGLLPPKWSYWLPEWSTHIYREQTLWQWLGLSLDLVLAVAIVGWVYRWRKASHLDAASLASAWTGLCLPAAILLVFYGVEIHIRHILNITGKVERLSTVAIEGLLFLVGTWFVFMLTNAIGRSIITSRRFKTKPLEAMMVRNGFRILGVLAAATILYFGGERLGVPVAPLFASLGVSSIAIGLGAKPYVENIIGGITLLIDRPVKVGDFCEFGGITGTVEDIGLRATRIRTRDRNIVTVPNTEFSTSQLVNYSQRDRCLLELTLNFDPETTRQQLNELLGALRNMLDGDPRVLKERVHFVRLSDSSLDVEIFAHVTIADTSNYQRIQEEFLRVREELLLRILTVIEEVHIEFTDSSQTLHLSRDEQNELAARFPSIELNSHGDR
ncbi:MAG: mechanosensitive ion channel [Cyanobacteriota bacterium]|nr:mechanosensitive ion channel [Cyanobacteriota bacterium]